MFEIIPAIMPNKFDDMQQHVALVKDVVDVVQLDIMDGKFVPDVTWPFGSVQSKSLDDTYFQAIQNEQAGLPYWEHIDYELDLMIEHPDEHLDKWIALGPRRIIVHIESLLHPEQTLQNLQSLREFIEIGLSFDDDYEVTKLDHYIELVDFIQVMGIDEIGKQGEPFEPRSLYNIEYLHSKFPQLPISVDGSVNKDTIAEFKKAGATRFVAGSAVFGEGDVRENIIQLQELIR